MNNTKIVMAGNKIYIITTCDKGVIVTTVDDKSKIEKRQYKSIQDMPKNEYYKIISAKALKEMQRK